MEGAPSPSAIGASWDSARSEHELLPASPSAAQEVVSGTCEPEALAYTGEEAPRPRRPRQLLERLEVELKDILDKQRLEVLIHVREFVEHHRNLEAAPCESDGCEIGEKGPTRSTTSQTGVDTETMDPMSYRWLTGSKGTQKQQLSSVQAGDTRTDQSSAGPLVSRLRSEISLGDVFSRSLSPTSSQEASRELVRKAMYGTGVRAKLLRFTGHWAYEITSAGLIMLNALITAWETHLAAEQREAGGLSHKTLFVALMYLFCAIFVVDLALHMTAQGLRFFYTVDWRWNMFDLLAVSAHVFEVVVLSVGVEYWWLPNTPVLRVARLARIARIVRALRSFVIFREFRITIAMLCDAGVVVIFFVPIMSAYCMFFGIVFTDGAASYMSSHGRDPGMEQYFGDLFVTMRTLFKAMTGGIDWESASEPLMELPWVYPTMFYVFVAFSTFAILNVVNAMFVDLTLNMSREDRDYIVQTQLQAKRDFMSQMNQVFEELDRNGSGSISLAELVKHFMNPEVNAYFRGLDLNVSKVKKLFVLMDTNRSGGIDRREFAMGCTQLRGDAKTLDLAILQGEVERLSSDAVIIKRLLYQLGDHLHVDRSV